MLYHNYFIKTWAVGLSLAMQTGFSFLLKIPDPKICWYMVLLWGAHVYNLYIVGQRWKWIRFLRDEQWGAHRGAVSVFHTHLLCADLQIPVLHCHEGLPLSVSIYIIFLGGGGGGGGLTTGQYRCFIPTCCVLIFKYSYFTVIKDCLSL